MKNLEVATSVAGYEKIIRQFMLQHYEIIFDNSRCNTGYFLPKTFW